MSAKILVNSEAGVGKTTLLRSLDPAKTLVISRDSKAFPLAIPHMLVEEYYDMNTFLYGADMTQEDGSTNHIDGVVDKMEAFNDKFGYYPETVAFDTVSQLTMDVINKALKTPNVYGSQGAEINKELSTFVDFLHSYLELNGVNIILLNHVIKDKSDEATEYVAFGQGKFKDKGGFFSIVDESITLAQEGNYLVVYTKGSLKHARSKLELPPKMYIESIGEPIKSKKLKDDEVYYTLQDHLNMIIEANNTVTEEFRL
jgi:hypothetical protein